MIIFGRHRSLAWFFLACTALFASCSGDPAAEEPKRREKPPVSVTVAHVGTMDVPIRLSAVGIAEPYSTVAVKSRVSGELVAVHFKEGQEVKEGDLLFTIDRAPFEVALKEARARLEREQALARKAQDDLRRHTPLMERDLVSRQTYDQLKSDVEAAEATVKADQAGIENLLLQLDYCTIRSPISGRTGSLLIQRGNLVKGNDENKWMITINQIQPILVSFTVPAQHLGEINRGVAVRSMTVHVYPNDKSARGEPVSGALTFVDNMVDKATATIRLKATFTNKDRPLWPGQIVNVVLTLRTESGSVVVPSQAIQSGQSGLYAFVVRSDQTVEMRNVAISRQAEGQAVIEKGLTPGETVVTDGQLLLTPGARVAIKNQAGNRPLGAGQ